jgi:light-regulated signal transduction histidine kinase (bacteriophytochrome)
VRKDGARFWADVVITALYDKDGLLRGFAKITRDVTERKRAEDRLNETLTDLQRSNKELEQFAYVASHDLQEPLRMVASYTQLLAERYENQLDDKAKKFIRYAVDGAVRMQMLINDLLTFSRVGTRGKPPEQVDAHTVLGEAINNLKMNIDDTKAIITNDELPEVRADVSQLVLLFQNLIGNSMKFHGTETPRIHISAMDEGHEWLFSVKDNGIGIDPQYADKVFIIFQRLHTKEEYPGSGIGLAICKKIVERHGGRIWFESESGKGATFFFTIPK